MWTKNIRVIEKNIGKPAAPTYLKTAINDLREGKTVVDGCPVQYIREMQPDGMDLLLGDVSATRNCWLEVEDEGLRVKMTKENSEKPAGDPSIVWTMGGVPKAQLNSAILYVTRAGRLPSAQPPRKGHHVRSGRYNDQQVDDSSDERPQNPRGGNRR